MYAFLRTRTKECYEGIGKKTVADVILDRIINQAHPLELKGKSMRTKQQNKSEEIHD